MSDMSKDTTLFQFDVDEDVARWLLSSIPGVTPLPPDEEETSEGDVSQSKAETTTSTDSNTAGSPGAEAHLDSTPTTDTGRSEQADIGHPTTPWPGAPMGEDEKKGKKSGLVSRLGGKKVLLAAGAVLGLGVIGVAGYWLWKKRSGKKSGAKGKDSKKQSSGLREKIPVVGGKSKSKPEPKSQSSTKHSSEDESESRSYPMDVSPVVGMGFLALSTVLLRRFRRDEQS